MRGFDKLSPNGLWETKVLEPLRFKLPFGLSLSKPLKGQKLH
jgi:hypothetical protein